MKELVEEGDGEPQYANWATMEDGSVILRSNRPSLSKWVDFNRIFVGDTHPYLDPTAEPTCMNTVPKSSLPPPLLVSL